MQVIDVGVIDEKCLIFNLHSYILARGEQLIFNLQLLLNVGYISFLPITKLL